MEAVSWAFRVLFCALLFSMRLCEFSLGYGKFEYKREGLTGQMVYLPEKAKGVTRHCVELSLPLTRPGTLQGQRRLEFHAEHSWNRDRVLDSFVLGGSAPVLIWLIACAGLQHAVGYPGDVAGNGVPSIVCSDSLGEQ